MSYSHTPFKHSCGRYRAPQISRRDMLAQAANGFGMSALLALSSRVQGESKSGVVNESSQTIALAPGQHHAAKAKSVIFLYMDGGPSQMDTFDPKPLLTKYHGQDPSSLFKTEATQFNNNGTILGSPWSFNRYGESGIEVSDLFPHLGKRADDLCVIRSMISEFPEHTFANYFLHTGSGFQGRPSMGSWVTYGLGSVNENLPGFVVLNGGLIPPGGLDCFGNGFLPASFQGSVFKPSGSAVANVTPADGRDAQQRKLNFIAARDAASMGRFGKHDAIESAIHNYELAAQMQMAVPELMRLEDETKETRDLYGMQAEFEPTRIFASECLIARRLVERGVRFIELTCPTVNGDRWDQHSNLREGHENNARAVDQPIAGLLIDLKRRGMLDETLVVWAGEFGRTPFAQGADGRDHNPFGFSVWLAGGGVRGGTVYGATDEWGYKAIEGRAEIHDLHATMLHLMGVDHTQSTFRFGGRDMRLTDVKGHVIYPIIA